MKKEYDEAQGKIREANKGSNIHKVIEVKSRGETKPGGKARIITVHKKTIVGQEVCFYDVEYLDDGRKEFGVDGLFVVFPQPRPVQPAAPRRTDVPTPRNKSIQPVAPLRPDVQTRRSNAVKLGAPLRTDVQTRNSKAASLLLNLANENKAGQTKKATNAAKKR